ncbi:3-oxoacyl-ACP synthase III family protein [Aureivirga marina]|uniref:3-oxoacyl-ACP synthase III family protein n=1 Tax=Aureivirga marina TaxID=1182451 RepID=UPI0018CA2A62|nr:ketoacyl-ACP synthase III [Aureivirga marina]
MRLSFKNKKITGVLSVLPENEVHFKDGINEYNFTEKQSLKLAKIMGYGTRRIASESTTVSDLCVHGLEYLFENNYLNKDEIDALILVTQSPDYFLPATSNVISGKLNLKEDLICMDINQGCAGYEVGLMQAYMLLEQPAISKVVLLNADVLSKKVSKRDRNSHPLIGDGATITVVEKSDDDENIELFMKSDGKGSESLKIPAGGFKMPSTPDTAIMNEDVSGNYRSLDNLVMKGDDVFNFVMTRVPEMMNQVYNELSINDDNLDYYLFHQPNKFMLEKLADKLGVDRSKMPNNITEIYGNGSGITVPLNICHNLGSTIKNESYDVCLGGFGVGLTWSLLVCKLGKLDFCEIINYKE